MIQPQLTPLSHEGLITVSISQLLHLVWIDSLQRSSGVGGGTGHHDMSSWLSEIGSSHRLQLGVTAVVSGCVAATAVVGLQEARKWYNEHELKESIPKLNEPHDGESMLLYLSAGAALTDTRTDKRIRRCRS